MSNKALKILGVILGLALISVSGFFIYNLTVQVDRPASEPPGETETAFPPTLQGLNLGQVVSGPRALDMISKLHGTDIEIKQGYIISYGGPGGQITIWISESNNSAEAKRLFDIMDKKIIESNKSPGQSSGPPFTDRRTFRQNDVDVVAVKGMGMENYYYQTGSKVYWIAAGVADPVKTLDEVMKNF